MPTFSDRMSGAGPYYYDIIMSVKSTNEGEDPTTTIDWTARIRRTGSAVASNDSSIPWNVKIDGTQIAAGSASINFPSGGADAWLLGSGTRTLNMHSDGYREIDVTGTVNTDTSEVGDGSISDSWNMPRVPVPPTAPGPMVIESVSTDSATVTWGVAADNGGGTFVSYTIQRDETSSFTSPSQATPTVREYTFNGTLKPATDYWTRVRIRMSAGYGPYNSAKKFTTDPVAPGTPTSGAVTINSIQLNWSRGANGNALDGYDIQYSTLSTFSPATTKTVGVVTTDTITGLAPGTTYYFRIRAKALTNSAWSGTLTRATLTANPPGISVTASPAGSSATVTLTPPATGVTKYTIERQTGTTGPVTTYETTSNTYVASGLTPGVTYRWRASAWFDTYQTSWSAWVTVTQPKPNTNPGDYFDGNTPDTAYADYSWDGTVNNSTSTIRGWAVDGWASFAEATVVTPGGAGAVSSTAGGAFGTRSARVQFFSSPSAAGLRLGTTWTSATKSAEVEGSAPYFGSIYVNPSRSQRMAAQIVWLTSAMVFISATTGTASVVSNGHFTRLFVSGTAPVNAARAAIVAVDVTGDGWSAWAGGDEVLLDAAMITVGSQYPYFDGSFPDDDGYAYSWLGAANASESRRKEQAVAEEDPLADPDCPPLPAPPRPPTILDECIDEVTVWRRYWTAIPAAEVSDWMIDLPTLYLSTAMNPVRQVRIRVYANPFNWALENVDPQSYCSEQIISYIPPNSRLTIAGDIQRVFAEVNGGGSIAADHLLYGTGGIPATWPELTCGIAYAISVDVPLDAPEGNFSTDLTLTRRM